MERNGDVIQSIGSGDPPSDRWPDRPGWEVLAQTIETLAEACGGAAQCDQKYDYLSVRLETCGMQPRQRVALYNLSEIVEQISDTEDHGEQSCVHWIRGVLNSNAQGER